MVSFRLLSGLSTIIHLQKLDDIILVTHCQESLICHRTYDFFQHVKENKNVQTAKEELDCEYYSLLMNSSTLFTY